MTDFWLIRHGSTDSLGRSISGWQKGVLLNPAGEREVRALAGRIATAGASCIYASPLERTATTARALADAVGCPVISNDDFAELRFGDWTGKTFGELDADPRWRRFNSFRSATRIPGGELMLQVQARAVDALLQIREERPDQRVLVVSHGDVIKAALCYFLGISLDHAARLEVSPASISQLELSHEHALIARINDCAHLERSA